MQKSGALSPRILELLADGKPRTTIEIMKELKTTQKVSSAVAEMWKCDLLLASPIKTRVILEKRGETGRYARSRERWYTLNRGEGTVRLDVKYLMWNRRRGMNVEAKENLAFTIRGEAGDLTKRESGTEIIELVDRSDVALFGHEIAKELERPLKGVRSALVTLRKKGEIRSKGWFHRDYGKEYQFSRGLLYYRRSDQFVARLRRHDVLDGRKQQIFDKINDNCLLHRRMTPLIEFGSSDTYAKMIKEISSVYEDLRDADIQGLKFYYVENAISQEELESEVERLKKEIAGRQSESVQIGFKYEDFCQVAVDEMYRGGDFKVERMWWEQTVTRGGKIIYNRRYPRYTNPRRTWEFDRVLCVELAPFNSGRNQRRLSFVFEMRYTANPGEKDWVDFREKLADTFEFGTWETARDEDGRRVRVRAVRHDVIPVMCLLWPGHESIPMGRTENSKKVNLATYITINGGMVLFEGDFRDYLKKVTGRECSFRKTYKAWRGSGTDKAFSRFLIESLGLGEKEGGCKK